MALKLLSVVKMMLSKSTICGNGDLVCPIALLGLSLICPLKDPSHQDLWSLFLTLVLVLLEVFSF